MSSQDTQLFVSVSVRSDYVSSLTIDMATDLKTDSVVMCGLICNKEENCSGMVYETETQVCSRMKKVERGKSSVLKRFPTQINCIPSASVPTGGEDSVLVFFKKEISQMCQTG